MDAKLWSILALIAMCAGKLYIHQEDLRISYNKIVSQIRNETIVVLRDFMGFINKMQHKIKKYRQVLKDPREI